MATRPSLSKHILLTAEQVLSRAKSRPRSEDPGLAQIVQQVTQHSALAKQLKQHLGEPLADHIHGARHDNETVTITMDSAIWASQCRFYQDQILTLLQPAQGTPLQKLVVKVCPIPQNNTKL